MAELKIQNDANKSGSQTESKDLQKYFMKCLHYAAEAHKEQKRKDLEKTPYINHPIGMFENFFLILSRRGNPLLALRANPSPTVSVALLPISTLLLKASTIVP